MPNGEIDFNKSLTQDALSLLMEQYKGKPVLQAIISSYTAECQELQSVIKDVILARDARTAYGIYLDVIGKIVQAGRNSSNDEAYRLLVNTKIAQNKSSGRAQDFETIWELLGNDPSILRFTEEFPAAAIITATQPITNPFLTGSEMLDVLTRIFFQGKTNAAGVRLQFVFNTEVNDFEYTYLGGPSASNHAYSDISNPGTLTYGKWASVISS